MGARSTRKGKVFERAVVTALRALGFHADRTAAVLESMGGPTGVDVRANRDGLRLAVQCKVGAAPSVWRALDQAEASAHDRDIPVAFVRRNRAKGRAARTLVVMDMADFGRLVDTQNR